jgi:hypothetical protein
VKDLRSSVLPEAGELENALGRAFGCWITNQLKGADRYDDNFKFVFIGEILKSLHRQASIQTACSTLAAAAIEHVFRSVKAFDGKACF